MSRSSMREFLGGDNGLLLLIALGNLFLHLLTNSLGGYGIFRDELYYLACAEHPAAGYVDHPPFSIYALGVSRMLLGDSLFALRLVPAILSAATAFVTGLVARQLGGGRWAQAIAALASTFSLINLAYASVYSMNAFDLLLWAIALLLLGKIVVNGTPTHWLILGSVLGIGLLNKTGVLWLGVAIFIGLLLTSHRNWLRTPWPYVSASIAVVSFLPYVLWNITHDFPHLEFIRTATQEKYSSNTAMTFLTGQILINNPVTLPLWVAGILGLLLSEKLSPFRIYGIMFLAVLVILVANGHSKAEYLAASFPPLYAAGGVLLEGWGNRPRRRFVRPVYLVLLVAGGLLFAPFVLTILPVRTYIAYADALGVAPSTAEGKELAELPQFYADMYGWEEKANTVARVYGKLSPADQARCAIFAHNYGRCAAIDFYGPALGLPKAIGSHNNYWIWGPRGYTGDIMIVMSPDVEGWRHLYDSVEVAEVVHTEFCMPYENNLPILLCRGIKRPLGDLWAEMKHFE